MNEALFKRIGSKLPTAPKPQYGGDAYDWLGGFAASTFSSIPELVGIRPSGATEAWRMENPAASFLSQVAGASVPYAGWFAATKKVKAFDKAIEGIGDIRKTPFLTGAAREAARFAPFEIGRVLASQVVGEEDLKTMGGEAAINLAFSAGVGGVVSSVLAAGSRAFPIAKLAPGLDIAAPVQIQARHLKELLARGTIAPDNIPQVQYRLGELRQFARAERLPEGIRYVNDLEGAASPKAAENINRLFKLSNPKSGFVKRRFVQGRYDFANASQWRTMATQAGLPDQFEDFGQYFRHVSFVGTKAPHTSGAYDRLISKNFKELGNGWFMTKEADDGLFVMARKTNGTPGKPTADDNWVIFKTDQPGVFVPDKQNWANAIIGKNAWSPRAVISKDGGPIYNVAAGFMEKFPLLNYRILTQDPEGMLSAVNKLLPKAIRGKESELYGRFADTVREYLTPARIQFTKSPRANWIHTVARATYDAAETESQRLLQGAIKVDPGKSIFHNTLSGKQGQAADTVSIKTLFDSLSDAQIGSLTGTDNFWYIQRNQIHGEDLDNLYKSGAVSKKVYDVAKALDKLDQDLWLDFNKTQEATGNPVTKRRAGHYGLSRVWEGDTRILLRGEDEKILAVASGFNRRHAQARAKQLQEALAKEGTTSRIAEEFQISQTDKIPTDARSVHLAPGFSSSQQNVRGFKWDDEPFTRQELMEAYQGSIRTRMKAQADMSVDDLLSNQRARLADEDPTAHRLLVARLNDLKGIQGPLGLIQNAVVDKMLGPILGSNSATKIAQVANTALYTLQLGALKVSFPVMNAITFLNTVVPEVAYITSAAPERLAGKYVYFAAGGSKGPVGSVGALNPLTLMRDSFREMRKPDRALLASMERAINDRVIDPRLVEDYVGESAVKAADLRAAAKSPGNFAQWLRAVSDWMPAQSERFSRAQAFTTGHIIARDFLGIKDPEALYRTARQFTENTMYLYSVADRPRIFTTPAGSMFGLFKNWMTNYTATMLEYMGEGVVHNNWSPLLWQTAGTFAVGGAAATPLAMVADGFSKAFSGKSMIENTYAAFNGDQEWVGDGLMYGLPAVLSQGHISLYSQASSPMSNPVRDASMLFSTAHLDRLQYFTKAMASGWDHWQATGQHPGGNKEFLGQLTRALAPTTVYRTIGAAEEGMISSLSSGYPILKDVGLMDRLFYMAGFNSIDMDKAYSVASELFADQTAHRAQVARLGQAYAEYQLAKDSNGMLYVLKQAYASGVDPSSVLRSSQARVSKMTAPLLERNFKPEDLARFSKALGGTE